MSATPHVLVAWELGSGPLTPYQASAAEADTTRHREAEVLDGLNRVIRRLSLSPVDHLSEALRGDSAQVLTWRPLDPYGADSLRRVLMAIMTACPP